MLSEEELIEHLEKIFDENGNEVVFEKIEIRNEKRKHSNTISRIMYVNGVGLTQKQIRSYKIQYLCRCGRHIIILLQKYMCKQNICCMHCLQDRSFENHTKTYPYSLKKGERTKPQSQLKKTFDEYDENFKQHYAETHLSENEFYEKLNHIYSINDIQITEQNINNIKYLYYSPTNNQQKFNSKISFDNGKTFNSIHSVKLRCSTCNKIFNIHLINIRKQDIDNIECRYCKFSNKTFEIRKYNDSLTYQSSPELKFIELCISNGINIVNGFEIPYWFKNKDRTYITDFYLPDYKYIVEIKARNIFYKNDLMSGKAEAKASAATNFGKQHGMKYKLIFDTNIDEFINFLKNEN